MRGRGREGGKVGVGPIGLDPVEMILGSQPSANPAGVIPCEIIRRYERIPLDLSHADTACLLGVSFPFRKGSTCRDRFAVSRKECGY